MSTSIVPIKNKSKEKKFFNKIGKKFSPVGNINKQLVPRWTYMKKQKFCLDLKQL